MLANLCNSLFRILASQCGYMTKWNAKSICKRFFLLVSKWVVHDESALRDDQKAFDPILYGILWEVLRKCGVQSPRVKMCWWYVRPVPSLCWTMVEGRFVSGSAPHFFGTEFQGGGKGCSSVDSGLYISILQHSLGWFSAKGQRAGIRISNSKSKSEVIKEKKVGCLLRAPASTEGI